MCLLFAFCNKLEKRKKALKLKLEMAKFLQDTIEETSLQRHNAAGESVQDFAKFVEKVVNDVQLCLS